MPNKINITLLVFLIDKQISRTMGGNAFTSGVTPLRTPRMPPEIYHSLRDYYLCLLSALYAQVATPVEAPSKTSYGDIDILVSQPTSLSTTTESLAKTLAAEKTITTSGSATSSFALPYPNLPNNHIQLDVHLCPPSTFHWQVFQQSHGDLWNLLGTTIRPFGLTANDVGLHLRIAEIEELNRKRSLILLTNEPDAVLRLLGLDEAMYQRPFESVEAMYEYVVGCRFFRGETYVRGDLKANDRKRMAQRELYRRFVDVWLPENEYWIRTRMERETTLTREDVVDLVMDKFGKRQEHKKCIRAWRQEREDLLAKQEGRQKRKADALEMEEYASAWITWLKHNAKTQDCLTIGVN